MTIPENTAHSGSADILTVDIKKDSVYCVLYELNGSYGIQLFAYYADGTAERIFIQSGIYYEKNKVIQTAPKDVVGISMAYLSNQHPEIKYYCRVFVKEKMSGLFNYPEITKSYIETPDGNLYFNDGRDRYDSDTIHQSIAVVNNQVWEFGEGKAYYNGVVYEIENGHANNCNWGKELHGDYPYLYCPLWTNNKINVFSFDGTAFTKVSEIVISAFESGNLDAYVDEESGFIYGFNYASASVGEITFFVADMSGNVIMQNAMPYKIPVIQNMCLHDGILYVVAGFGTDKAPDFFYKIATNGTMLAKYPMYSFGEIEGIDFLDNKMILASYYYFFIEPVLVPETVSYGYTEQLKANN